MDLAIRFPAQGRIHLESRFLFAEPDDRNCRQFVERVFQAPEITQVTIRSQAGFERGSASGAGFCPRTYTLKQVVERVKESLNPGKSASNGSASSPTARPGRPTVTPMPTDTPTPTGTPAKNGNEAYRTCPCARASGRDDHVDHAGP